MNNPIHRQRIMKCGWLRKQGGMVRTWHRRWFCLNGDCLFYFAKEDDLRPQGSIFLPGNKVSEVQWTPDDPDKYLFEICPDIFDNNDNGKTRTNPNPEVFLLCANNNEERQGWMKAIRKVIYSNIGGAIYGQSIEETMLYEHRCNRKVPYIVEQCVEFLTEYGLEVEGIFRLPGRTTLVKELKDRFDCAEKIVFDISEHDVHSVASLLKMYFRELPESIIPSSNYQILMNVAMNFQDAKDSEKRKEAVAKAAKAMSTIPEDNCNIVRYLCEFLCKIGEKSDINKMTTLNLATVFGPNIIRNVVEADSPELMMATADLTQQLAYMLINNYDEIFVERKTEVEETKPEVPVDNLLDLSEESGDQIQPLSSRNYPVRNNNVGYRGSSLLTSVTEELAKRRDNDILKPISTGSVSDVLKPVHSGQVVNNYQTSNQQDLKLLTDLEPVITENKDENISPSETTVRKRPVPPARRKKKETNGEDVSPNDFSRTNSTESVENEQIVALKAENTELRLQLEKTREEFEAKIKQLKDSYGSKITVLRTNNNNAEKIYKEKISNTSAQVDKLKKDLEVEKQSKMEAVERVLQLQTELNRYHLQYGQLH